MKHTVFKCYTTVLHLYSTVRGLIKQAMESKRTFRDGCVSFANPCVTSVKLFEPEEIKSWSSTVLDQARFNRRIEQSKDKLEPLFQKKIEHFKTCSLNDHDKCILFKFTHSAMYST